MRFDSFQEIGWIREWVSVIRIMIKYYISRLSNSFLICVFLEQSENISWQLSFNGRKYHLFYTKLFRLYLIEETWVLVCHEVWFSCVEVAGIKLGGNEPERKYKYLYSKTYSRYTHFFENYQGMFLYVLYFGILYVWRSYISINYQTIL